jgi:uncharacterized protein YqhQ
VTEPKVQHTHIGGQAVLEGIMMRGKYNWAIAVRNPDGTIHAEEHDLHSAAKDHAWLRWPIIRGVWALYETFSLALKAFSISAEHAGFAEEEGGEIQQLSSREIAFTMVLGFGLAALLFIVLPAVATNLLGRVVQKSTILWNVINGAFRIFVFFAYILAVSRMKDIKRVFAYHGAEHKTIHAYEHEVPLDTEHIQEYGTLHIRCGTSFLLMVMIVAVIVYMFVPVQNLGLRILSHLALLPVVAGLAYEVSVKWAGNHTDNPFVKVIMWPGLQLQRMTTSEPDDSMVEIAIAAVTPVIERERAEEARVAGGMTVDEAADECAGQAAEDLAIT